MEGFALSVGGEARMKVKALASGVLLVLAAAACVVGLPGGEANATVPRHLFSAHGYRPGADYRVRGYKPKPIPAEDLPDYQDYVTPLNDKNIPVDKNGVALLVFNGRRKVYHPLVIARYGISLLHSYRITENQAYLDRAEVNAAFLVKHAARRYGALYFPYRFNYRLFGNPSDLMRAPWYSAMAQGAALMLFLRLYGVTQEPRWQAAASSTFATFVQRRSAKRPWTVFVARHVRHRYLWLEEYAKTPPTQPLNGHMYALFGVYEYALTTRRVDAIHVFDGAATTIRYEGNRFRVPGGISYYSLRVHAQYPSYHCVHVWQLKLLGRMTGDPWFASEGRRFGSDGRRAHAHC
jgi:hypothetical protein